MSEDPHPDIGNEVTSTLVACIPMWQTPRQARWWPPARA